MVTDTECSCSNTPTGAAGRAGQRLFKPPSSVAPLFGPRRAPGMDTFMDN